MKSKPDRTNLFLRTLKFQNLVSPILLAVVILLLTAGLSTQVGNSLLSAEAQASELICPADIISYWTLDENTGSPFADSTWTNDATCTGAGCPASVTGLINRALAFDGINDGLNVPDDDTLDWAIGASFSIELWVQTNQSCSGDKVYIGKFQNNSTRWWLGCSASGGGPGAQGLATFLLRDSAGTQLELTGPQINDGNWHHLVAVRDAAGNANLLYVDGATTSQTQDYTGNFTNANPLTIGYYSSNTPGNFAGATIDEVALYSRALTHAEILEHYNGGAGQAYCREAIAPQIEPIDDQNATVGLVFTYDVVASGDPAPTFALTTNPDNMTIDEITGAITWTPTTTGVFDVTVAASNSADTVEESFTISVASLPAITPIPDQGAVVGQLFTYDVEASGDPAPTFALTTHPDGMTIDENTGLISWTPVANGIFDVTVEATNSAGSHDASFTIEVTAAPVITSISDQTAVVGELFTYDVEASGDPAPTFSLLVSPDGMAINASTGVITWTPTATGTFDVTVEATNDAGFDTEEFTITVNSLPAITAIPDQTAVVGEPFTYDVEASGDPAPTFSLLVSPGDMAINASTGVITWTPTTAGNANVTVRAQNSAGAATANFTIAVADIAFETEFFQYLPVVLANP